MPSKEFEEEKIPFSLGHLQGFKEHIVWQFFEQDVRRFVENTIVEIRQANAFKEPETVSQLQGRIQAAEEILERIDIYEQELLAEEEKKIENDKEE